MKQFEKEKEHKFCKIAILGVHDTEEQWNMIEKLTADIKRTDYETGLILIGSRDKLEEIKKSIKFNIDAYIPKNSNSVLRIHNTVKKLISEHSIGIFRRRRNYSVYAVVGFLLLSLLLIAVAYLKFPQYF
jgi:hypothetical protein